MTSSDSPSGNSGSEEGPSLSIVRPCSKPVRKGLDIAQYVDCLDSSVLSSEEKEKEREALIREHSYLDDEEDVYNQDKMLENSRSLYASLPSYTETSSPPIIPKVLLDGQVLVLDDVLSPQECDSLCENILKDPLLSFWCQGQSETPNSGSEDEAKGDARSFRDASTIELFSYVFAEKIWRRIKEGVEPYLSDLVEEIEEGETNTEISPLSLHDLSQQFLALPPSSPHRSEILQNYLRKKQKLLASSGYILEDDFSDELRGTWLPLSLNPDMLFAHYPSGGGFSPHTDGNAILGFNTRSRFSVIVYLNTPGEGLEETPEGEEEPAFVLRDPVSGLKRSNRVGGGTRFYRAEATSRLVKIRVPRQEGSADLPGGEADIDDPNDYYWGLKEDERIDSEVGDTKGLMEDSQATDEVSLAIGEIVPKKGRLVIFHQRLVHASVPVVKPSTRSDLGSASPSISSTSSSSPEQRLRDLLLNPYQKFIIRSDIITQRQEKLCDHAQGRLAYRLYQKAEKLAEEERGLKLQKEAEALRRKEAGLEEEEQDPEDAADEALFNGRNEPESVKLFKRAFKLCREMAELMGQA